MFLDHYVRSNRTLSDYLFDFGVDQGFYFFTVGFFVLGVGEGDIPYLCVHTELCNYVVGQVVGFLEIVVGTCGDLVEEKELGAPSAQNEADSVKELFFGLKLVLVEKVLGKA